MTDRTRSYRDLIVWQRSMDLHKSIYRLAKTWPAEERFILVPQIRRAALSIPSNIAEGHGRHGSVEFARFVSIAHGSLCELETQILVAVDLEFSSSEQVADSLALCDEVGLMLRSLLVSLKRGKSG